MVLGYKGCISFWIKSTGSLSSKASWILKKKKKMQPSEYSGENIIAQEPTIRKKKEINKKLPFQKLLLVQLIKSPHLK